MKHRLGIEYSELFRVLPNNYLVLANDSDFTIVDVSNALIDLHKKERSYFLDKPLLAAYPIAPGKNNKEGGEQLLTSLKRCIDNKTPDELGVIRYDVKSPHGKDYIIRYWKTTNYPIIKDGEVRGVLLMSSDATEEVLADERLRAISDQDSNELPAGVIGSWRYTAKSGVVIADTATAHMFGISEQQAMAGLPLSNFTDFIHPDDRSRVIATINDAINGSNRYETEYRIVAKSGDEKWVISRGQVSDDGLELVGVLIDVTDRKNEAIELRESEERLRFMADAMPQMVWISDADGQHEYFNKRWYDYTKEEVGRSDGEAWKRVLHPDDVERTEQVWSDALRTGENYEIEYRIKDGETGEYRWFIGKAVPYKYKKGKIARWYGTCTDIQDRKNQEEILEAKVAERTKLLVESNRELENFAYVASHDLQEPLRKIQAFGNLLVDEYGDKIGDGALYLERMKASASRMGMLIEDLLAFSRITTKQRPLEKVQLEDVLGDILDTLENQITRTKGRVEVTTLFPPITIDPFHIRQLLQNIISNGLKFHKPGVPPVVKVSYDQDELNHIVKIKDNGIGFDDKYAEKIFSVFQRLHGRNEYEGTGIGLAICRKIAERYNGTIEARGNEGEGALFILRLPKNNQRSHDDTSTD